MSCRVGVVAAQDLVRAGLAHSLDGVSDLAVVAQAGDGMAALGEVRRTSPDVVLMDIRMPVLDGISATRRLLADHPQVRVVILTTFDLDEYVYEALRAGATGFVLKDSPAEVDRARLDPLTEREREVLVAMAKGLNNDEVARALFISEGTVRTHVNHLLAKLQVRDRVQAVVLAYETGLVQPGHVAD